MVGWRSDTPLRGQGFVNPNTGPAGGKGSRGCEGHPSPQTSAWPGPPSAGAYAAQRLYR
jgi:hypothetical protein